MSLLFGTCVALLFLGYPFWAWSKGKRKGNPFRGLPILAHALFVHCVSALPVDLAATSPARVVPHEAPTRWSGLLVRAFVAPKRCSVPTQLGAPTWTNSCITLKL